MVIPPVLILFAGLILVATILAGPTLYDDWKKGQSSKK